MLFLVRELLGRVRAKSALYLALASLFLLLFLVTFAAFFLFSPARTDTQESINELLAGEVMVRLSPRLSAAAIDALYLEIRDRSDVARINFQFARETDPEATGGRFRIEATSVDVVAVLVDEVRSLNGVTDVSWGVERDEPGIFLSTGMRIGLLCGLVVTVMLSLVLARAGLRVLLESFAGEIRILRLSGLSERQILPPVVGLGLLIGLIAGLLLLVGLVLLRFGLSVSGSDTLDAIWGLATVGRTLGIGIGSLFLGILIGGLSGLFGASILSTREFSPLP